MSLFPRTAVDEGLRQRTDRAACPWSLTTTSTGNEPVVEEQEVLLGQVILLNFSSLTPPLQVQRTTYSISPRGRVIACIGRGDTYINLTDTTLYNYTMAPLNLTDPRGGSNTIYQELNDSVVFTALEFRPNDTSRGVRFEPSDNFTIVSQLSGSGRVVEQGLLRTGILVMAAMFCVSIMSIV